MVSAAAPGAAPGAHAQVPRARRAHTSADDLDAGFRLPAPPHRHLPCASKPCRPRLHGSGRRPRSVGGGPPNICTEAGHPARDGHDRRHTRRRGNRCRRGACCLDSPLARGLRPDRSGHGTLRRAGSGAGTTGSGGIGRHRTRHARRPGFGHAKDRAGAAGLTDPRGGSCQPRWRTGRERRHLHPVCSPRCGDGASDHPRRRHTCALEPAGGTETIRRARPSATSAWGCRRSAYIRTRDTAGIGCRRQGGP